MFPVRGHFIPQKRPRITVLESKYISIDLYATLYYLHIISFLYFEFLGI
jgi:hypothetical protein